MMGGTLVSSARSGAPNPNMTLVHNKKRKALFLAMLMLILRVIQIPSMWPADAACRQPATLD
jgi:hypothetical protein